MDNNKTELVVVVDRSGSMRSIVGDVNGGLKDFIDSQAKEKGQTTVTLTQFDTVYEILKDGVDISDFGEYNVVPRGCTALLDAVGRTIATVGERLSKTPEDERPGLVTFLIVTDGHENSSQEFTTSQIAEMVKHQREVYNWQFTFLGCGDDVFAQAEELNLDDGGASFKDIKGAFKSQISKTGRLRTLSKNGVTDREAYSCANAYTPQELEQMK